MNGEPQVFKLEGGYFLLYSNKPPGEKLPATELKICKHPDGACALTIKNKVAKSIVRIPPELRKEIGEAIIGK